MSTGRTRRVLVVDDDESIREFISLALADEGYTVAGASHGAAALSVITEFAPQVILLDMRMPIMDGWTFSETYRRQVPSPAPIVVVTAARDASELASQIKADGFLSKPFDLNDLLTIVDRFTSGYPSGHLNGHAS